MVIANVASRYLKNHDDRWHDEFMATSESNKRVPLGPTGELVAENIKRRRGSMQYKELSEKLTAVGRAIPPLGLRRIEAGERRVDVDDLMALAVVFGVSPLTLLLPSDGSAQLASPLTGAGRDVAHNVQWLWATGNEPLALPSTGDDQDNKRAKVIFQTVAKPPIDGRNAIPPEYRSDETAPDEDGATTLRRILEHLERQGLGASREMPAASPEASKSREVRTSTGSGKEIATSGGARGTLPSKAEVTRGHD